MYAVCVELYDRLRVLYSGQICCSLRERPFCNVWKSIKTALLVFQESFVHGGKYWELTREFAVKT